MPKHEIFPRKRAKNLSTDHHESQKKTCNQRVKNQIFTIKIMMTRMILIAPGKSLRMKNIPPNSVMIDVVDSLNSASFMTGIL